MNFVLIKGVNIFVKKFNNYFVVVIEIVCIINIVEVCMDICMCLIC